MRAGESSVRYIAGGAWLPTHHPTAAGHTLIAHAVVDAIAPGARR